MKEKKYRVADRKQPGLGGSRRTRDDGKEAKGAPAARHGIPGTTRCTTSGELIEVDSTRIAFFDRLPVADRVAASSCCPACRALRPADCRLLPTLRGLPCVIGTDPETHDILPSRSESPESSRGC